MYVVTIDELKNMVSAKPDCIINGCCLEAMPRIADHSIDMVLVDPPYGVCQIEWDQILPLDTMWRELKRVLKARGVVCITATMPFAADLVNSNPDWFRYDLIWVKNKVTGHLNAKKMPLRSHESILVFYDNLPTYNPQMTNGHDPLHYAINRGKTDLFGKFDSVESRTGATDRYPKSVLEFPVVNNSDRIHPTQKPVELFIYLMNTFTNEGDTVLDITAGSLTTAVAAQATKRHYICIEKEATYIESGVRRLQSNVFEV